MKQCPCCDGVLQDAQYEGVSLLRCSKCRGVLVKKYKLEFINHGRAKDAAALRREARDDFAGDTRKLLRCPRCRSLMHKRPFAGRYARLTMDVCRTCESVWLDGGELAIVQLVFEASARGRESVEMKRRIAEMEADPVRKARFEAGLAQAAEDFSADARDVYDCLTDDFLARFLRGLGTHIRGG